MLELVNVIEVTRIYTKCLVSLLILTRELSIPLPVELAIGSYHGSYPSYSWLAGELLAALPCLSQNWNNKDARVGMSHVVKNVLKFVIFQMFWFIYLLLFIVFVLTMTIGCNCDYVTCTCMSLNTRYVFKISHILNS